MQATHGTVTRIPADEVAAVAAVQGWAMTAYPALGGPARGADLVFLHGLAGGGWIWPRPWLRQFREAGYTCHVLTLPGREGGQTLASDPAALDRALALALGGDDPRRALEVLVQALPGAALFDGPGLGDFADAVEEALARIGRPAVVVAHSLGGAVAQTLLRRGRAPAGTVLLCAVPPYGMWRAALEMAVFAPDLWRNLARLSLFGPAQADMAAIRDALFPGGAEASVRAGLRAGLRDESLVALLEAQGFPPFAPLPGPRGDMLVIGGARDRFVRPWDVGLTGLYYGSPVRLLPGAGHMPMQEPASQPALAAAVMGWLDRLPAQRRG